MKWWPLLSLALFACPPTMMDVDAGTPIECETRADCMTGLICTPENRCATCDSSGQCSLKEVCSVDGGLCTLREGWGTECATNETCQAGSWCKQGLCQPRASVSLCAGGLNSECPQGERCNRTTLVCEEDLGCSTNDDCGAAEVCNTGSRACVPKCTVETQGEICAAGERCVNSRCAQCATNAECGVGLVCDAAGKCVAGDRCYTDRDCKVPLTCFVATGACLPKPPPCVSNDNCLSDQRCDVRAGRCVPKTCQPDRYEANDSDTRAFNVAAGSYRDLTLCQGDVDWFAMTLSRGDQLGINVDGDNFSENNFSTVIKDSTGRTVSSGHFLVSYVAPVAGKYFGVVSTIDPYQSYDITFLRSRGTPCDDDMLEPNDGALQATALNAQTSADGIICPQDQDWFATTVPAMRGLTTRLTNYDASRGLLQLCLFTGDGMTEISCSDALQPSLTLPASMAAGTPVLVRVSGSNERSTNGYTLAVEFP